MTEIDRAMSIEVTQADREAAASVAVLSEMRDLIRTGQSDHHAEPWAKHRQQAVAAEVAQIVAWLGGASVWLNGGECCGQKCSDGVCCAPACLWGEELKLLHSVADAIERGEYKETSGE